MPDTVTVSADLDVERSLPESMRPFTAEGEKRWAHGSAPTFPAPGRTEGRGAVFVAEAVATRLRTTWVMVEQEERVLRYARMTSETSAGTVTASAVHDDDKSTVVLVT
ncbi:MAG: hypothetical protein ACREN7_03285 [Candidatus Dormibacteria bacterium]